MIMAISKEMSMANIAPVFVEPTIVVKICIDQIEQKAVQSHHEEEVDHIHISVYLSCIINEILSSYS